MLVTKMFSIYCFVRYLCRKLRKKVEFLSGEAPGSRYDSSYWYYQPAEDRIPGRVAGKLAQDRSEHGVYYPLK